MDIIPVVSVTLVALLVLSLLFVRFEIPFDELKKKYGLPPSAFMAVSDITLHFRDQGNAMGKVILLLHGTNVSLHTWEPWVNELKDEFRLISIDLPGHGLTGPFPNDDYSCERVICVLKEFMEKLGVEQFSICGNSYGGYLAWRYALEHREQIERLILIDASGYPYTDPFLWRLARLPGFSFLMEWITPRFLVKPALLEAYVNKSVVTEDLVTMYYELMLRQGNRHAQVVLNMEPHAYQAPPVVLEQLKEFPKPTLILWGEGDPWLAPTYGEHFERDIPDSLLKVYKDTGHVVMEEHPGQSANDLREFMCS